MLIAATSIMAQQMEFPKLTGPYLGQTPPIGEPILFAPGIVSTNWGNHSSAAISPDGKEIYWEMRRKIFFTKLENGKWSQPEIVSFCTEDSTSYDEPFITPDGQKLFFTSMSLETAVIKKKETIWYAERTVSGWKEPQPVSPEVNAMPLHWSISVSNSGTLYFQGTRDNNQDIYFSKLVNGVYTKPVNMGPEINTAGNETCPYIAPDESYIIFTRMGTSPGNSGIFISYRDNLGKWMPAVIAEGGTIEKGGLSPRISPDGKYLFYVNGGMWWMPAGFIEELKPKEWK